MSRYKDRDYPVGKGKPPKHSQFKKGESGNPSGRKKTQHLDAAEAAARALERILTVLQDGAKIKVSGMDALFRKIYAKAAGGDMRAAELILRYAANDNVRQEQEQASEPGNEELIERFFERYAGRRKSNTGG
jgi:hypothetical protein